MGDGIEYRVSVVYETKDNSSRGLREIGAASRQASQGSDDLANSLKRAAVAIGAFAGFGRAKSLLIDYNSQLEQSKTVIAGMLTLYTGQSIERTWDRAATSIERFQNMAKRSSLTTKDLVETAQGITRPLIQVGVKMDEIEKITFGVANAAKAFGMNGGVVAMDIEQALRGGVSARDRFMKSMLAQKGIELSADQFNKKTQDERVDILKKALTSPAISAMANKQSGTLSGVFSTLEDNVQIAFGKIGLPLVAAITSEIKGWNDWVDKNGSRLEEMGKSFSSSLMFGFRTVKDVVLEILPVITSVGSVIKDLISFAADHKDALIGLAKALIVLKVGEKIGGMARGIAGGVGGFFGGVGNSWDMMRGGGVGLKNGTGSLTDAFTNLGSVLTGAGGLIAAFSKLAVLGYGVGSLLLKETEAEKNQRSAAQGKVLASKEYDSARKDISMLEAFFGKIEYDPSTMELASDSVKADYERLTKLKADLAATEANLIAEGKKAGAVTEQLSGDGTRTLNLLNVGAGTATNSTWKEVDNAHSQLLKQLSIMFEQKALQAARENGGLMRSGIDNTWGSWWGGMRGGHLGFYKEKLLGTKEAYEDGQAKAPSQTINITIQRVMAKDPNRWLIDMDDMVKSHQRSATRAKGSWRSSPR